MRHILLVDDELNYRRSLMIQLELEGYQVTEVDNAVQALSYLSFCLGSNSLPDMVITDIQMPEMKGDELAGSIKAKYPNMPVVMISAFDPPEGCSQYPFVRKPFKLNQIITTIQNA